MNESPNSSKHGALVQMARSLGRSRSGQLFVAVAVAAFFAWLAYVAWHHRDLASVILAVGLIVYVVHMAWRFLPIPAATRARWTQEDQVAEGCPAWQYRGFLWCGIGVLGSKLWRQGITATIESYDFVGPCIFMVIGAVSYAMCRRYIRQAQPTSSV